MTSRKSHRARLDMIESELLQKLRAELEFVANSKDSRFFNLPHHMLSPIAEELSELALQAIGLRELLGEPDEKSVGVVFRSALRDAADTSNHHRLGPIRQAAQLLAILDSHSQRDA